MDELLDETDQNDGDDDGADGVEDDLTLSATLLDEGLRIVNNGGAASAPVPSSTQQQQKKQYDTTKSIAAARALASKARFRNYETAATLRATKQQQLQEEESVANDEIDN
jgi:hypothetical protein